MTHKPLIFRGLLFMHVLHRSGLFDKSGITIGITMRRDTTFTIT